MRRCLGCNVLIQHGSRCALCRGAYRSSYSRHDWAQGVKDRDGWRCVVCGSCERLQADHLLPLALGGRDTPENGITLCHDCHVAKHRGNRMEIA